MKIPKIKILFEHILFNDDNKTKLIGLLTILIVLWLVLYFIPELFVLLFNNILGNLILILIVILLFSKQKIYGFIAGTTILVLYRLSRLSKETFTTNSQQNFLQIQNTINRNNVFDMNIINQQASQQELDYFNKHGMWPWSDEVINLYTEAKDKNPYIRSTRDGSTDYIRTIYNQAAILQALSYQTKEGQMLINGVLVNNSNSNSNDFGEHLPNGFGDFGNNSGLTEDYTKDIIKCNLVENDKTPLLERITYTGKSGIFNQQEKKIENVDYNDLENIIPGFKFLNSPCNPCKSIGENPDYSCPFSLQLKDKDSSVSNIWNYLWGTNNNNYFK